MKGGEKGGGRDRMLANLGGGGGSFVLDKEAVAAAAAEHEMRQRQRQQGGSQLNQEGSFVLNREANLHQDNLPESPKLWRKGPLSLANQLAPPPNPAAAARTTDDLYKFYETIANSNKDLSLKDLVEQAEEPIPNFPFKTLTDREVPHEGGGGGSPRHQDPRPELWSPLKAKVALPPKANGGQTDVPRRSVDGPFPLFPEDRSDKAESPRSSTSARTPENSFRRQQQKADAGQTVEFTPPRYSIDSPFAQFVQDTSDWSRAGDESPRRSTSARTPDNISSLLRQKPNNAGQTNDPRPFAQFLEDRSDWSRGLASPRRSSSSRTSDNNSFLGHPRAASARTVAPQFSAQSSRHSLSTKSPLRTPAGSTRLASPQRRVSALASASSPARLGGGAGGGRIPSSIDWVLPPPGPRDYHRADKMYSAGSPLHPAASEEHYKFFLADCFQQKTFKAPRRFKSVHPANHCSTCSAYTLFKTRCLVCGNIYCRNCVKDAMGSMPEGRKCTNTCVGRPVHSKYISQAGNGCFHIPRAAKIAELKWVRRGTSNSSDTHSVPTNSESSMGNASPLKTHGNSKSGMGKASPLRTQAMHGKSHGLPTHRNGSQVPSSPLSGSSTHNQNAPLRINVPSKGYQY